MIRRSVKMTSSAVSGLPSWKVMPGRSLITQLDVEPCGLISSASTNSVWAPPFSWSSGWYSDWARAVSRYVRPLCGSRVSVPDPPVRPTFSAPPRRLAVLLGDAAAWPDDVDPEEQALSRLPAPASAPAAANPLSTWRRSIAFPGSGLSTRFLLSLGLWAHYSCKRG